MDTAARFPRPRRSRSCSTGGGRGRSWSGTRGVVCSMRNRFILLATVAFLAAAALLPGPADAKIREPADLGELARDADVIAIGRVRAVIPSLFSLPGMVVVVASAVGVASIFRRRRFRLRPVVRDGLILSLMVILFGGLRMATTPRRFHRRIA